MSTITETSQCGRVLIVTATVGSGHNSAARAIAAALRAAAPAVEIDLVDLLSFTPWAFRAYYAGGFALAMSRFPRIYGLGYKLSNRPHGAERGLMERCRLRLEQLATRRFRRYVLRRPYDLIVHTHFLGASQLGRMIARGLLDAPQVVVATDIELHRFWYSQNVEHWFVPAEHSAEILRRWRIDPARITVSGIPIHDKWTKSGDRREILADWRLPSDRKIVLLSGGTEFTCGPIVKIARRIAAACPDAYLVVLAGRNKKLLGRLCRLPEAPQRLVGVGFTDRLHELVEVCSLMATKAGGITTAECLAKSTPMVLLKPIPGHEAGNAAYLHRKGAAVIARNAHDVARLVAELLGEQRRLARLAENAASLYRPAARTIAEAICRMVSKRKAGCSRAAAGKE